MSFQGHQVGGHVVHVFIGVREKQLLVPLEGIGDVDLRYVVGATEAARGSVGHADDDEEVVYANQLALDFLSGRLSHGDGHLAAAGPASGCAAAATPPAAPTGAA